MLQKQLSLMLFVALWTITGSVFGSEESPESMSLNAIRHHFGGDKAISRKTNGHFPTAQSIIDYISHSQDVRVPSEISFLKSLEVIDAAKKAELKRVFGCQGESSSRDSDEISERRDLIELLIGFALKIHINKKIQTLADKNRTLNILKDELAQATNAGAQEANRNELRLLRAEAQSLAEGIKKITRDSMADVLEQVSPEDREEIERELTTRSGLLTASLFAIVAAE